MALIKCSECGKEIKRNVSLLSKEQKKWYNNNIDKIYKNQILE